MINRFAINETSPHFNIKHVTNAVYYNVLYNPHLVGPFIH